MKGIFAISVLLLGSGLKVIHDTCNVTVHRVTLKSEKWRYQKPLKIIQIADMHNRRFGKNGKKLFQQLKEFKPDIIVLTGDLIDRKTKSLEHTERFIQQLTHYHQDIFFVNGNHECENPKRALLHQILQNNGITILQNEHVKWHGEDINLNVVGIDDAATNQDDLPQALEGIDASNYTILLSHAPNIVWEKKEHLSVINLILSEHTHSDQIRLPIIGALVVPEQRFTARYDQGVYQLNQDTILYIDSGLGTTRLPVRFFNRSQITYLEIYSEN